MRKNNQNTMQSEIFIVLMIFAILLFIVVFQTLEKIQIEKKELEEKIAEYTIIKDDYEKIKKALTRLKENQQPPIIVLEDAKGYSFNTNSSTLSDGFHNKLRKKILTKIEKYARDYNCDILEVYGYTDGQAFARNNATAGFDKQLHSCLENSCNIDKIKSSSNLELGMQRAVSIITILNPLLKNNQTIKIIRPYSGGQFINSNGKIADSTDTKRDASRRRIEIRLSRSTELLKEILKKGASNGRSD